MHEALPSLIGVIHLPPLPGSPRFGGSLQAILDQTAADARALEAAGFEGIILENFGDAPFFPERVPPVTVAAMTAAAMTARAAAPTVALGVNVLRNDAEAALAVAVACGASMIRVNVHVGARITDQGMVQGRAHETLRLRRELQASAVRLLCDVDVKHSAPLTPRPLGEEAEETAGRGLADAILVTGTGTGRAAAREHLETVHAAVHVPVLIASGVTETSLPSFRGAHGVIVGSCLRASGRAGDPVDAVTAARFVEAFRKVWRTG
ncbi:BtpA/SgcQ family protein [Chondromyces apiculatus]|uniref:Photosystem I biogenesis protein BtpA n=1 Tax=Chondromyces apiculatus DSM 436 TaxID=1192034 RepID=A0A017T8I1_9BACT|nr:BtpA/SgcQ family protein [Chondromyces apiculatus]EYF05538.1 photosystem I biogenesis protein BtpA [Chondromyces apiculatus DSM 436]